MENQPFFAQKIAATLVVTAFVALVIQEEFEPPTHGLEGLMTHT